MADEAEEPPGSDDQPPEGRDGRLQRWRGGALGRTWRHGGEMELMRRSMGFASQSLVTLVPLLIVAAAIDPFQQHGFAQWVADGMGLPPNTARPVQQLFASQHQAARAASLLSLVLLAVFGLAFVSDVQAGYEKVWRLPPQSWRSLWRSAAWLGALTAYIALEAESGSLLRHGLLPSVERLALLGVSGLLFFWWGQYFLLGGRVAWRALLPGAAATVVGLGGLRLFSSLVFDPMIVSNAEAYGAIGILLVVQSWLIGVGFVFYGGALVGRYLPEAVHRR